MTAQLVWDAFKGLLVSLRPPTIFPAAVFVLAHVYGIVPRLISDFEPDSTDLVVLWIGLIVLFSYMLHGMGFRLMTWFRGGNWLYAKTAFGNKMDSVTKDIWVKYRIDWTVLSPCFKPILAKKNYPFISQESDALQLFINLAAISVVLGLESFYIFVFLGNFVTALILLLVGAGGATFFYSCVLTAVERWGETIKAACALYRHDLAQSLYLKPAQDFDEEQDRWEKIAQFFLYNSYHCLFTSQYKVFEMKQTAKSSDNNSKVEEN